MVGKILAGILLALATGSSVCAQPLAAISSASPFAAVADSFFTRIEGGDYSSAYQLMSPSAKRRQSIGEFQKSLGSLSSGGRYSHSLYFSGNSSDPMMPPGSVLACFKAVPRFGYGGMIYMAAILTRASQGEAFAVERYQAASEPYRECPSR
jgi:hypothetical protein